MSSLLFVGTIISCARNLKKSTPFLDITLDSRSLKWLMLHKSLPKTSTSTVKNWRLWKVLFMVFLLLRIVKYRTLQLFRSNQKLNNSLQTVNTVISLRPSMSILLPSLKLFLSGLRINGTALHIGQ